jgi:hypothetical protein
MYRFATVVLTGLLVLGIAISPPCAGQEPLVLPEGVTHVALPPGTIRLENIMKDGKHLLRLTVDKLVIHGRAFFLGDGKNALQVEATKEGMHWARPGGRKGFVIDGTDTHEPGSIIGAQGGLYWKVGQLKPGSVYLTTPSIKFEFKP